MPRMSRRDTYLDHLAAIPMFSACSKQELRLIGQRADECDIPAGEVVIREGKTGREFFIVVEGTAKVTKGRKTIAQLGPGDSFGELALLERVPRTATVTTTSPMVAMVLDRPQFAGLLNEVPSLAYRLLQGMARRLRDADARAVH